MRVIAGRAKGRRIAAPRGRRTRPTPDRVRESLFSILGPLIAGARVLDLFAGTGALGIEALSRGAQSAVFVEQHKGTAALLRDNLAVLGEANAQVLVQPVERALPQLGPAQFNLVFLDPPYHTDLLAPTLAQLHTLQLVAPRGWVVAEHLGSTAPPSLPPGWELDQTRLFGDVALSFISPPPSGEPVT